MKKILLFPIICGCLCAPVFADREEREERGERETREVPAASATVSSGTITEYTPESTFVVRESSGPVKYRYGKHVTYITRGGKALSNDEVRTRIRVGIPVHVTYATEGEDRVISRVELDED